MTPRVFPWSLALGLALAAPALADPPTIANISPYGLQRGVPVEITINGGNLTGNPQIVAEFPVAVEPPPAPNADAANWKLKATVPPSVAVGVYTIRVKTDDGISNPFLLAIGQLPQVAEKEDNSTFEAAQPVPAPAVIEGQSAGSDVDFFRFPGKKGQRIVVDAQCARIGSGVDPQIRLTTAGRAYVASADDTAGLLTDARLTAVLPEDGDYVVEISDTRYQGGGRPVYRLTIGAVPVVDEVYPLGGRRGETVGFELRGGTLPEPKVAAGTVGAPAGTDDFRLRISSQTLGLGDPPLDVEMTGPLAAGDLPELRESADPNAPPVKAPPPVVFNGRIDPPGDEDRFTLPVTPGQTLRIQAHAANLGSGLDGTLQVLGPNGAVLSNADDTTTPAQAGKGQKKNAPGFISPDPSLVFVVPAGANEITLALRDLEGRGGVGFPYRIEVEPAVPTFAVALSQPQVSIRRGGTAAVPVTIARQGYNGAITLSVQDPPAGLTVRPGTVADGQGVGTFTISASADASFGPAVLKVIGTGQTPGGPIVVPAENLIVYAQQGMMPIKFEAQVGLVAAPAQPAPVALDVPATVEVVHGIGGPIPLKVARQPGNDAALAVKAYPLPPGLAFADQNIAEKAVEGAVNLGVAPEAPLGTYTIALNATGKLGGRDLTLAVPAVTLNVIRPAALELAAAAVEVKAGATVEVKGKVLRKGAFKEPVAVRIDGLPAGLKVDPVTVAPDAAEFTLKIVADPSAAAAMGASNAVMAFKIFAKDYATPPTPLAVKVVK